MKLLFWKKEKLNTGQLGEKIAAEYLKNKGYKVLEKNFKNPLGRRLGEIDIIAKKNGEIVFVEVKTRELSAGDKSLPEENITKAKLHKLNKIALFYIKQENAWDKPYHFDALSVWIGENRKAFKISHLENIFI
ncbi:MAG: YraN family protein [Candidatus Moranbacteria bacterium]|nr:YraN family protein [Candidatus Moranbacteria bacterium]